MATEARAAWPFSGTDAPCSCTGPGSPACVYRKTSTSCAVWVYTSTAAGHVHLNTVDSSCICASTSDPTWN